LKTGIIVFAHGSSVESANDAVRRVASDLASAGGHELVEAAFLEGGTPTLFQAAGRLYEAGVRRIIVVPYFLTLGLHIQRDLPRIAAGIASVHPDVRLHITPPLDGHPALGEILLDRVRQAVNAPGCEL